MTLQTGTTPKTHKPRFRAGKALGVAVAMAMGLVFITGCEGLKPDPVVEEERETIFGKGGLTLFGGKKKARGDEGTGGGIGVNSFLWRASLDTISFMPVSSADPFGGVIITDWYSPPETPNERFKVNVYILGRSLRADGVRVTAFRQARASANDWVQRALEPRVTTNLENAILTRAQQLRAETVRAD